IAVAAAADVVDLRYARRADERSKRVHEIGAVDVIANLFAIVTKDAIRPPGDRADHEVREKTVQLRAGVRGAGETTAAETDRRHVEVTAVFLDENIGRGLRRAEERVLRVVDAHRLGNPGLVFVARFDFPAQRKVAQRQTVRG